MANITFLIGNGFDLNYGMNTRYSDVYAGYIELPTDNALILDFQRSLKEDKENHFNLWSDFEIGMGRYASHFKSEGAFLMCLRNFKQYMVSHIKAENTNALSQYNFIQPSPYRSHSSIRTGKHFSNCILHYMDGCVPNERRKIESTLPSPHSKHFQFITFNYTELLDYFVTSASRHLGIPDPDSPIAIDNPLHIHGKVNEDIVLGVDHASQIKSSFELSSRGLRAFVKPVLNKAYDEERITQAEDIINSSDVICVYGLSFGDSDLTWTNCLLSWLVADKNHHLILNSYQLSQLPKDNGDLTLELEEEHVASFLYQHASMMTSDQIEQLKPQIHIPIGTNIFDPTILQEEISDAPKRLTNKTDSTMPISNSIENVATAMSTVADNYKSLVGM